MTGVAVFGSSEPAEGTALYEQARSLGRGLALAGYEVVTGGYGGVMAGASRGAVESGGFTLGVTCEIFDARGANRWLCRRESTTDLFERTRRLIDASAAFVVLAGKAGTLAELTFLWALHRAGCLERRPVLLLGDVWPDWIDALRRGDLIDPQQLRITHLVGSTDEAVDLIRRLVRP